MNIQAEMRSVMSIRPCEHMKDAGVNAVAASIKDFGFHQRIVVDEDGVIVVGQARYMAAVKL
jgi:ParB-like chromosome segregation protein Spo0J